MFLKALDKESAASFYLHTIFLKRYAEILYRPDIRKVLGDSTFPELLTSNEKAICMVDCVIIICTTSPCFPLKVFLGNSSFTQVEKFATEFGY